MEMSEKLRKFIKEGQIIRYSADGEYYVVPGQGKHLEALLVAEELCELFDGWLCGCAEEIYVRECAGEDIWGPYISFPVFRVMVNSAKELESLLEDGKVKRELLFFPLKEGMFPATGATVCSAVLMAEWEKEPEVQMKACASEMVREFAQVLSVLKGLFPDGLSALFKCGSYYFLGNYCLYQFNIVNLGDRMMFVVEGKEYTPEMSVCKKRCGYYGIQCKSCALGAKLGGTFDGN